MVTVTLARDIGGTTQQPAGMHTVGLAQAGDSLLPHDFYDTEVQPVQAGNRYCIAAWVGTANCRAYLFISFHDAAGGFLSGVLSAVIPDGVPGGTDLSSWTRAFVFGTAPAGAATLRFNVRQMPTAGATTALTRLLRPTIEQALPGQTQPSMWAESANGMRAAFREATDAIADDVHAQSTAIQQLSARLDNGGDVHNALVQVTALAESTASAASGSWGVVVDADGKLAGIKALSDGRTSQIVMSADQVLIDGTLTARKIAAGAVTTDKLQAGAVSADKIAVTALSAISAALGSITSAAIELVSAGWSYIRTSSKWWADGVDGFIQCASPAMGYFQEFRASSGNALILEQKGNGLGTGWKYYLQVRDGAGIDRLLIDPASGTFKFRGAIIAESGSFAGSLSAASGSLGTITSGYLQNAANTCSFDLNATGSSALLRAGGKTLIAADGNTRFNNIIYDKYVGPAFFPITEGSTLDSEGVSRPSFSNYHLVEFDTGITLDPADIYSQSLSVRVTGWTGVAPSSNLRVIADARLYSSVPGPAGAQQGCNLRVRADVWVTDLSGTDTDVWANTAGLGIRIDSLRFTIAALS